MSEIFDDGHPRDHHCRHSSDTDNFRYLGDALKGEPSDVGFLGTPYVGMTPREALATLWFGGVALAGAIIHPFPF